MRYFSTKEAAQRWGISPRRVALLASQGKIRDAAFSGNVWLIPDDAQKPADSRCRKAKNNSENKKREIYPYILWMVHSQEQVSAFTDEEKELYRACKLHEEGEFVSSRQLAEKLLSAGEFNVRLGAQYLLSFSCMYQFDYAAAAKYSALFMNEYYGVNDPSPVLRLLVAAFYAEMGRASELADISASVDASMLSKDLLPHFICNKLFAELLKYNHGGKQPELAPYEVLCILSEADGYSYPAMVLHLYLSVFYALLGESGRELAHMNSAIELCLKNRFYFTLSCLTSPNSDSTAALFSRFTPEIKERMGALTATFNKARYEYAEYTKRQSALSGLSENDYRLIFCCLRGYTIDKTAEILGLSRSGTNRRLAKLYDKLGVDSMKEMKRVYYDAALDWGK